MPLTRDFKETVAARVRNEPDFRNALLREAVEGLLHGEIQTGKAILRDYVNATIGFRTLAERLGKPAPSLMRMLGPSGNPRAGNMFAIIAALQEEAGVKLEVVNGQQ